jgi:hypothetical protein
MLDNGTHYPEPDTSPDLTAGDQFMLAEFETMRYFHGEDTSISERRVDILLAVTSGIAAGLVLLAQTGIDSQFLLSIAVLGCLGLLLIGVPTFFDTLNRDLNAVDYIHALNAIRDYFSKRSPAITPFLLEPTDRHHPKYGSLSSSRRASAVINSLAAGTLVATLRMLAFHQRRPDILAVVGGLVVMLVIFAIHAIVWGIVYRRASRDTLDTGSTALSISKKSSGQRAKIHPRAQSKRSKND